MKFFLRLAGALLLLLAGSGTGLAIYMHKKACWQELHTLARLFQYLQGLLSYQSLTGEELLKRAVHYPEFSRLLSGPCTSLEELPLPESLPHELKEEVSSGLKQLAFEPRNNACRTLGRLAELCAEAAAYKKDEAQLAKKLWPRLGLCAGILTAILFC